MYITIYLYLLFEDNQERSDFEMRVTHFNYHHEMSGRRFVSRVPERLKRSFVPRTTTNRTPPLNKCIIAGLNDVHQMQERRLLTAVEAKRVLTALSVLAGDIKALIRTDNVVQGRWKLIESRYQLYYCLKLEECAARQGIRIDFFKNQWAARNLLSLSIKRDIERQQNRERREVVANHNVVNEVIYNA